MAINQFAVGFLLVGGFFQADHLSDQTGGLSAWTRAEGGRCCNQEGMVPLLSQQYGCRLAFHNRVGFFSWDCCHISGYLL